LIIHFHNHKHFLAPRVSGATRPLPEMKIQKNFTETQQTDHAPIPGPEIKDWVEVKSKMERWRS